MCGIAGILQLDGSPVSPADLQRMTDAVAHRGPDACRGPLMSGWLTQGSEVAAFERAFADRHRAGHDANTMAIPFHNKMSAEDYAYVIDTLRAF